jgi:O-antigen/teichoic acid export membrane protein
LLPVLPRVLPRRFWGALDGGVFASAFASRVAGGAAWSLVGAVGLRGGQLLAMILVARWLGREGYGQFSMVQATVGMAGALAGYGLGMTVTRAMACHRDHDRPRAGRIQALTSLTAWGMGGLFAIVLLVTAPWVAAHCLSAPELTWALRLGALTVFLSAVTGVQAGALAGLEAFKITAGINVGCGLAMFPALLGGAHWGGLNGAIAGLVAVGVVNWGLNQWAVTHALARAGIVHDWRGCWGEWRLLWSFGVPAFLAGAMTAPVNWGACALLAQLPGGYAELGVFNAVLRIKQTPEMLVGILAAPLLPVLSHCYAHGDRRRFTLLVLAGLALSMAVIVPPCLVQMVWPSLSFLPYGDQFHGDPRLVRWLMAQGVLVSVLGMPLGWLTASTNRMWLGFFYNLAWGAAYLLLAYVLVRMFLGVGLAAANALAYLLTGVPFLAFLAWREWRAFSASRSDVAVKVSGAPGGTR